jgi:hypothetical protein
MKRLRAIFAREPVRGDAGSGPVFKPVFTSIIGDQNGRQDSSAVDIGQ